MLKPILKKNPLYFATKQITEGLMLLTVPGSTYFTYVGQTLTKAYKLFEDLVTDVLEKGKLNSDNKNLLKLMVDSQKFSPKELQVETFGFLIAGQETTAKNVLFTIISLCQFPEVQKKVQEEIDRVVGDKIPDWDSEKNLPYLKGVLMESHRYYSIVQALNRTCAEDVLSCGYLIPKSTSVWFCPHVVHRNPNIWENPNEFIPERFIDKPQYPAHQFCAFGAGSRICIGKNFALNEGIIILAMIYQNFSTKLLGENVEVAKINTTLHPTKDVMVQLTSRKG